MPRHLIHFERRWNAKVTTYTVGEAFCTEKIIVLVDSEYEAEELLRSCEKYCGVDSDFWSINSECTWYCDGRGYRYDRVNCRPHRGMEEDYYEQIKGWPLKGYRVVRYSNLVDELSHEPEIECDILSLLGSIGCAGGET